MPDSNMALEDILQELAKYGRPHLNQYAESASFDAQGRRHQSAGTWGCEVSIPSKWGDTDRETCDRLGVPVTGWRMSGRGTMREAAEGALRRCEELAEGPLAPFAKFVSEEDVRAAEKMKREHENFEDRA